MQLNVRVVNVKYKDGVIKREDILEVSVQDDDPCCAIAAVDAVMESGVFSDPSEEW